MLWKIAWKNCLAYKRKSIITIVLVVITTGLLVFTTAFMSGSHTAMIQSGVEIYPGYIQIVQKDYRTLPGLDNLIFETDSIKKKLSEVEAIETFGVRFETYVLYSKGEKAVAGLFTGIEPEKEQYLSRLAESLTSGQYLSDTAEPHIYMGEVLAKRLGITLGDTVSFIGTAADYSFTADNLTLTGLFKTGLFEFDANGAFVSKKYIDTVMASTNIASYFVAQPIDRSQSLELSEQINELVGPEYIAEDWSGRLAGLVKAMEVDSIFGYITLGIIFLVIFFVIMIYTYLSVFTRVREVGILRAIGTTPNQIMLSFIMESIQLSLFSVILGGILGGMAAYYFQVNPIDAAQWEDQFKQYGLAASPMPAHFSLPLILRDSLIIFVLSVCSTLYPIIKIVRFKPVEAIKHV